MQPNKYPGFFDSCVGILFLGTPHRGSGSFTQESALLTAIASRSDLYQHLETDVLESMTSRSGSLLDVADDFITLCVNDGLSVSCFFEQRSSKLGKVIGRNDIQVIVLLLDYRPNGIPLKTVTGANLDTCLGIHCRFEECHVRWPSQIRT